MKSTIRFDYFYDAMTFFLAGVLVYSFLTPDNPYQGYINGFVTVYEILGCISISILSLLIVFLGGKDVQLTKESKEKFNEDLESLKEVLKNLDPSVFAQIRMVFNWLLIFFVLIFINDWSLFIIMILWRILATFFMSMLTEATKSAIDKFIKENL